MTVPPQRSLSAGCRLRFRPQRKVRMQSRTKRDELVYSSDPPSPLTSAIAKPLHSPRLAPLSDTSESTSAATFRLAPAHHHEPTLNTPADTRPAIPYRRALSVARPHSRLCAPRRRCGFGARRRLESAAETGCFARIGALRSRAIRARQRAKTLEKSKSPPGRRSEILQNS